MEKLKLKDAIDKFLKEGEYELKHGDDFQYHCDVKVNVKNAHRFVPGGKDNPHIEHWKEHAHEIYIAKAKHLYHKIREQYDGRWWD